MPIRCAGRFMWGFVVNKGKRLMDIVPTACLVAAFPAVGGRSGPVLGLRYPLRIVVAVPEMDGRFRLNVILKISNFYSGPIAIGMLRDNFYQQR